MEKYLVDNWWILILILAWSLPWKGTALWRAARRGHIGWFLTLLLLNTLAILDILYIFLFSGHATQEKTSDQDDVRQARMQRYREQQQKAKALQQQMEEQQEMEPRQPSKESLLKKRSTII